MAFFRRINDDYHHRAAKTEYHDGEIKYDYLHLNCAKTIGSAFKYGAGYRGLEITSSKLSPRRKVASAANANIPTEMAMKLLEEWNARGYGMDVVLYRKYDESKYVDPHEEEKVAFKDLPNRFPSVLSRDFRKDQGEYKDFDNLFAMHSAPFTTWAKHVVRINDVSNRLEIERSMTPMAYPNAAGSSPGTNAQGGQPEVPGPHAVSPAWEDARRQRRNANRYELSGRDERVDRGCSRPRAACLTSGDEKRKAARSSR